MDDRPVGDELFTLPLGEFVHARNERANAARSAGDRELADQLRALRKPTVAAWLANQVARAHPGEIGSLMELGERLRSAMVSPSGPQLRRLNAEQRTLTQALLRHAREAATAAGHPMTATTEQALTDTLHAALADPAAGAALASGRLVETLTPGSFGDVPTAAPSAPASAPARPTERPPAEPRATAEELRRARRDVVDAQERRDDARQGLDRAASGVTAARRRSEEAAELVARLGAELAEATAVLDTRRRAEDKARADRERAQRALAEAEDQLAAVRRALDELAPGD